MLIGMGFRGMGLSSGACFEDHDLVGSCQGWQGCSTTGTPWFRRHHVYGVSPFEGTMVTRMKHPRLTWLDERT